MVAQSTASKRAQMVNSDLLNKAVKALIKHHDESESDNLLGNELPVQVQFTLARIPEKTSARPIRVEIPHPLHKVLQNADEEEKNQEGLDDVEVCIFVKDESKQWVKELLEKFPSHTSCIKKVLTLTSLRKKYSQYKDRRELLKRYDLFLADDRILPMLGKSLGKNFFQEKKQPIPLKLTRKEALPFAIQKCLRSTYMWISPGTCVTIKAGNTAMPIEYLVENMESILTNATCHIPRKWSNISAINVKTSTSVALPVYNKTREELEEIAKMAKVDSSSVTTDEKKRNREEDQEANAGKDTKKVKKQKKEKSLLVKALKQSQKKQNDGEVDSATPSKKKKKSMTSSSIDESAEKKKTTSTKKKAPTADDDVPAETPKSLKKKKKTDVDSGPPKNFIASKKFKGAKKGYAFKMGKSGLGYYVDVKPIPDKMALEALSRISKGSGGRRKKKTRR